MRIRKKNKDKWTRSASSIHIKGRTERRAGGKSGRILGSFRCLLHALSLLYSYRASLKMMCRMSFQACRESSCYTWGGFHHHCYQHLHLQQINSNMTTKKRKPQKCAHETSPSKYDGTMQIHWLCQNNPTWNAFCIEQHCMTLGPSQGTKPRIGALLMKYISRSWDVE